MRKLFRNLAAALCAAMLALAPTASAQEPGSFVAGDKAFLLNGEPFVVKAAELHYPRIPRPYWRHRIQMCKALGMNTVCLYVFWNAHEPREGEFDFSGNLDVAGFCRLAQEEGMYVIVRPGPYVCAEWEMGGLPWWLLKKRDIALRESDPYFLERVERFEAEVGKRLAGLTIDKGGPIIMVQVENEYGAYGEDKEYVATIRDIVRRSGFDGVTLFQCDWSSNFTLNGLDDLVWTMNFGTGADIDREFRRLGELRPGAPQMCSEFWSGWFDKWGARHETRPAQAMTDGIDQMLRRGISFSLYMAHGGTSFGHWAGANSPGFQPDVTSYDYDAPISEQGLPTPKFYKLREVMAGHSASGRLPAVPKAPMPTVSVPGFRLGEFVPLGCGAADTVVATRPVTFEEADMGWGTMVYTTTLPRVGAPSTLAADVRDYGQVFLDGRYVGKIDRVRGEQSVELPPVERGARLDIVVEGMGRINFGRAIKDFKGIVGPVVLRHEADGSLVEMTPGTWRCVTIPDGYDDALRALAAGPGEPGFAAARGAGYYRGFFNLRRVGDTFLNMEAFGKGQVYVNGHPLGRFWGIGPQQTLYLPGCWLKRGENEVIVLDVVGPGAEPVVFGQERPELDKLRAERGNRHDDPAARPDLSSAAPALVARLAPGGGWQSLALPRVTRGRHVALECLSTHDGGSVAAIAEFYVRDADGNRVARDGWRAVYADSEDGNHTLDKAFDLQESTCWQTEEGAPAPHLLMVDMGQEVDVAALEYLPRMEAGAPGGVAGLKIYVW